MDKKYILYKASGLGWNEYGRYDSKDGMIYDLIYVYGIEELEECDESEISSILDYF